MPSVNQVISDVRNDLNKVHLDGYIPARYLHAKLIDAAKFIIKRSSEDRRIYLYPDIWTTINALQMEEVPLIGCSDIAVPQCMTVMKSVLKLPDIFTTTYGYLLNVSSIDYESNYIQTTPREFVNKQSRRYQNPKVRYFWIYNNHLVIPKSMVQTVTLRAMFCNKAFGMRLEACDCPECIKVLEQEFVCPGHLLNDVKTYAVQQIAGVREKIPPDEYPNLNAREQVSPVSK